MKVFISYAHQDKDKAFYLKERLEKNGYEVLGDFNLKIGESFKSILDTELLKADAVVMLITKYYTESRFASKEATTAYAYSEAGKEIKLLLPEHEITRRFFQMLEETIRRNPPYYLWTHNRWKRTREEFDKRYEIKNGKVIPKES